MSFSAALNHAAVAFKEQCLLKDFSTFNIGGPARYLVEIHEPDTLKLLFELCSKFHMPFIVLGKGSNCLFDDRGFDGLVVINKVDGIKELSPGIFWAAAGASFALLGVRSARLGWSGLEFASGIPASVGGAVFMNAGAAGKEVCDSIESIEFLSQEGETKIFNKEEAQFSYRNSVFHQLKGAIIAATFSLNQSAAARSYQIELVKKRSASQPYSDKSAGCIFKNPPGNYAGALIEKIGLKGKTIGGASVSLLHANFIVNSKAAKASDVLSLIQYIKEKVYAECGVMLQDEVRFIPYQEKG